MRFTFCVVRPEEKFLAPHRHHPGDAGFDLTISRYVQIFPNQIVHLSTNIAVEIPKGSFGMVLPRSSTLTKKGLCIDPGIVDSGYRGEVQVIARNITDRSVHVDEGERVAQLLILPTPPGDFAKVESLGHGDRDKGGFGSTGGFNGD
jgi:dUTP pyrophosphatase